MQFVVFTKTFAAMTLAQACEKAAEMGFEGLDVTVRRGGHIDPYTTQDVAAAIASAGGLCQDRGLSMPMLTCDFVRADDAGLVQAVFEAAASVGVSFIKLGYWKYEGFGTLSSGLEGARRDLDTIEPVAARTGVCAVIHNHSGAGHLTAVPGNMARLLDGRDPHALGAYLDAGHIVAEGIAGSWRQGIDMLTGLIRVVGLKSYGFFPHRPEGGDQDAWKRVAVAYDKGTVPWVEMLDLLRKAGFDGPMSMHCEYAVEEQAAWSQLEADLRWVRQRMA